MQTILVTGGAGYIGSITCVALLEAGLDVVAIDNFSNSSPDVFDRIAAVAGRAPAWAEGDIRDADALDRLFADYAIDGIIHFAGLKAVGESVERPLDYYDVNVHGSRVLLDAMLRANVRNFVFSSSATVYGEPEHLPMREDAPLGATNPYGRTKLVVEGMLRDLVGAAPDLNVVALRYFNPAGAHPSGKLGEAPLGVPNNLLPFAMQVAVGMRPELVVFGDDYPTPDGTCIRDYIHVCDLAAGHVAALESLPRLSGFNAVNLGTGKGNSVREVIETVEAATGSPLAYRVGPRRAGDVPATYADPALAESVFGWKATRTLLEMCNDAWRWQQFARNG